MNKGTNEDKGLVHRHNEGNEFGVETFHRFDFSILNKKKVKFEQVL